MVTSDYEIVIAGELPAHYAGQFAPADVAAGGGRTVLYARDIDQAALHGIIGRIAALGLTLVAVSAVGQIERITRSG